MSVHRLAPPERRGKQVPRVFLGLAETAGYYSGLETGFRELGIPATRVDLSGDSLRFASRVGATNALAEHVARKRNHSTGLLRGFWRLTQSTLAALVLLRALPRHDVFIFGSPQSALVRFGYPLLRLSNKRIISVFHGSDARPPYLNAKHAGTDGLVEADRLVRMTRSWKRSIGRIERMSDIVVNHPPSAQLASTNFVDFLTIGIPFRKESSGQGTTSREHSATIRVLHAPSHSTVKGTHLIREAVNLVRGKGHAVDYVELARRPHAEILRELEKSDIVVDQTYSDQPMPSLATEAAAHGVPVVIGSCDWTHALDGMRADDIPPTIRVHPTDLAPLLEDLAADSHWRLRAGMEGQEFVRDRWAPHLVAGRYLRLISGDIPACWWRNPANVAYVHGVGLSAERLREIVSAIVRMHGARGLGVGDKPALQSRLLRLFNFEP